MIFKGKQREQSVEKHSEFNNTNFNQYTVRPPSQGCVCCVSWGCMSAVTLTTWKK